MRLILFFICCISFANATQMINKQNQSIVMKFDLLMDENIDIDDPRIKSIIYSSGKNKEIKISYFNPNAQIIANKIYLLLDSQKSSVSKPEHSLDAKDKNYVLVWINY